MVGWPWLRGGSGKGVAARAEMAAGSGGEGPRAAGDARPPAVPGAGGTWQEVFHSGNATASNGGTAVSGIYNDNSSVSLPPGALRPPAEVDAPAGLDDLPIHPGPFVGRGHELDRLDAALSTPGAALVQAVHGLGGIGKSTLAAHWATTRPHGRAPIRWITADSPAGVQQGLAALATALQPALARALTAEALAEYASQWLASHTGWLLVLDNVNDPADIAPLIARAPSGRFLITSRLATAWNNATTLVRLDVLDPAESFALLTSTVTAVGPRDLNGAAELCAELGHLPLAIEQAAAYLAQNPLTTPRAYLDLLDEYPAAMYRHGAVTTPAERTIARIWNITLDRIATLQPQAADLLRLLAWYAPDQIPATLLDGLADPPALNAALGLLTAYSMITPDPATNTLAVHRLVQALARTPDPDDPHRTPHLVDQAHAHATTQLNSALPPVWETPATWPTWRTLVPHIDALTHHTPQGAIATAATAQILSDTGLFLNSQGLPARTLRYLHRALTATERLMGDDHPSTLAARHNIAYAYRTAGDLGRATPLYEQVLTDMERVLGTAHPDTLTIRDNLAYAYQWAGDLGRAIPLFKQSLADTVRMLGEDHPDTLGSRSNLGLAYLEEGDLGRAIPLFEQTLADMERVLDADHPRTLTVRDNLAGAYRAAGDPGRAIPLQQRVLDDRVRVLGEDHPDTLLSGNNLGGAYLEAGDLGRAIPLFEQTLADMERVLDADHPHTLGSRNNLAAAYRAAGDLGRAIPLYEETLASCEQVFGEDHPKTLSTRNNLAYAYRSAGDLGRAILLYERTLADMVRILGEDHPHTRAVRGNLARAVAERGDGETG
ncbi:FxSxx-COOH system tetratricopeptide repeat protein [Streptomyces sp. T028]|uniref:FxSxx-COOH system tetratricopeptide repeat protein n=1 Tax=Streptomyces sp. T028 TaxID=3394379 RepID=UPI003A843805